MYKVYYIKCTFIYGVTCQRVVQGAWPRGCTIFLVKTSLSLLLMYMEVRDILDKVQICKYYFDGLVLSPIVYYKALQVDKDENLYATYQ